MHTEWVAKEVVVFDTIDSTNTKAQELAEKGYPSGTLVVADKQESGKGRPRPQLGIAVRHRYFHDTYDKA